MVIDPNAVSAALEKRNNNPEPEARFMRMTNGYAVAYALRQSCTINRGAGSRTICTKTH